MQNIHYQRKPGHFLLISARLMGKTNGFLKSLGTTSLFSGIYIRKRIFVVWEVGVPFLCLKLLFSKGISP
jgi:hypothetical protein